MSYNKEMITVIMTKRMFNNLGINSNSNSNSNNDNIIETTADITSKEDASVLLLKALDITLFLIEKIINSLGINNHHYRHCHYHHYYFIIITITIIIIIIIITIIIIIGPILVDGGGLAFTRFIEARLLNEPLPEVLASSSIEKLKLKLIVNESSNNTTTINNSSDQSINSYNNLPTSNKWSFLSGFILDKKNTNTKSNTNSNSNNSSSNST